MLVSSKVEVKTFLFSVGLSELYNVFFEVDAHAIYVRSLPVNATPEQLEEEFKKFGTIKHDGIQVRSHKVLTFFLDWSWHNSFSFLTPKADINIYPCKCRFKVSVMGLLNSRSLAVSRVQ